MFSTAHVIHKLACEWAHLFGEFVCDHLGSRHLRASKRNGPRKSARPILLAGSTSTAKILARITH